jgi:hypothetical protein
MLGFAVATNTKEQLVRTFLFSLVFLATAAAAHAAPLKECAVEVRVPDRPPLFLKFQVNANEDKRLTAHVSETAASGIKQYDEDVVARGGFPIRKNLDPTGKAEEMNPGERLVAHAMLVTTDQKTSTYMSTGVDLKAVRYVIIYLIGPPSDTDLTALIEAKDESGKVLGTYLGGNLVRPCK